MAASIIFEGKRIAPVDIPGPKDCNFKNCYDLILSTVACPLAQPRKNRRKPYDGKTIKILDTLKIR